MIGRLVPFTQRQHYIERIKGIHHVHSSISAGSGKVGLVSVGDAVLGIAVGSMVGSNVGFDGALRSVPTSGEFAVLRERGQLGIDRRQGYF